MTVSSAPRLIFLRNYPIARAPRGCATLRKRPLQNRFEALRPCRKAGVQGSSIDASGSEIRLDTFDHPPEVVYVSSPELGKGFVLRRHKDRRGWFFKQ